MVVAGLIRIMLVKGLEIMEDSKHLRHVNYCYFKDFHLFCLGKCRHLWREAGAECGANPEGRGLKDDEDIALLTKAYSEEPYFPLEREGGTHIFKEFIYFNFISRAKDRETDLPSAGALCRRPQ